MQVSREESSRQMGKLSAKALRQAVVGMFEEQRGVEGRGGDSR